MANSLTKITNGLARVAALAGLFSFLGTALGQLLGDWFWLFDLATHFTPYYAGALIPAALALLLKGPQRRPLLGGLCLACLAWNGLLLRPYLWPTAGKVAGPVAVKVMSLNVLSSNRRYEDVLSLVAREDPDVVALYEISSDWLDAMRPLAKRYETTLHRSRSDNFGIAFYTRFPVEQVEEIDIGDSGIPSIAATLTIQGKSVSILATHPLPPVRRAYAISRNRHLRAAASWAAARHGPTVVMGDLNITPWSPHFRRLLTESGLRDSALGRGVTPTWYVRHAIGLPIDHILHSPDLAVISRDVGPFVGSDHRAVVAEFALIQPDEQD